MKQLDTNLKEKKKPQALPSHSSESLHICSFRSMRCFRVPPPFSFLSTVGRHKVRAHALCPPHIVDSVPGSGHMWTDLCSEVTLLCWSRPPPPTPRLSRALSPLKGSDGSRWVWKPLDLFETLEETGRGKKSTHKRCYRQEFYDLSSNAS